MASDRIVLALSDPEARDASVSGAKAANIACAATAGLPTVRGFVLTTSGVSRGLADRTVANELADAWRRLVGGDAATLVVRSSSTVEDAGASSMAGRFTSVVDVRGWRSFLSAVQRVIDSAARVGGAEGAMPMAVLVQRQIDAVIGGVMFGVDPVSGERSHVVVDVVGSKPDVLVGGTALADHYVLTRRGRIVDLVSEGRLPVLGRRARWRLVRLARRAERVFGAPQDIEWCRDRNGAWWLLQSRPVTAVAPTPTDSPLLGPGPVAETFPRPLRQLEQDLWLEPLRTGVVAALDTTGAVPAHELARSPVMVVVGGRPAVDLGVFGVVAGERSWKRRVDPRVILRHVAVAWRVGRLRVALPAMAATVLATVDKHLAAIPRLDELADDELVTLLERSGPELAAVHRLEVLSGMLLHGSPVGPPGAVVALQALREARAAGVPADEVLARAPEILALWPPSVLGSDDLDVTIRALDEPGRAATRRDGPMAMAATATPPTPRVEDLEPREALRLRARWLQELRGRLAGELGGRLHAAGVVPVAGSVRDLSLAELLAIATAGASPPDDLPHRAAVYAGPPLPTAFRLDARGGVHAVDVPGPGGPRATGGTPAGGGRVAGVVRHRVGGPAPASEPVILVVRHLEPQLAPVLEQISGLVSETGSPLSHLAILAREQGVPTVVAVPDALRRYQPGARVLIDGTSGTIDVLAPPAGSEPRRDGSTPSRGSGA